MPRIQDSSVERVRQAADMLAVVGARTPLRRAGARWTGRCPFHEERTPSFSVSPEKGFFYCFGCGKGGDLITFVRETENVDFAGAIEWLAERFDVPIEYEQSSPEAEARRQRGKRLHELLEQATAFYERYLWEAQAGEHARAYLAGRGLGEAVCREFRLGLAPAGGSILSGKALGKGFTRDELAAAGLTTRRGTDYFSGRLVFPLADARGRIVGFQARRLRDDDPLRGKYVNSPEGELFRKGDVLYGLNLARTAIAKQDRAVVVEGNTDVIALRQAGFEPVVASMGTALTDRHVRELARLTRRVYLCFDGDAAGAEATLRGMELASAGGLDVRVVALPSGVDPADAPAGFEERLAGASCYLVHRVRVELDRAADRQEAFVRAREVLARYEESPERQEALRLVADRLDLPKETQAGLAPSARARGPRVDVSPRLLSANERLERDALAGVVAHPGLVRVLGELGADHFDADVHRRAVAHLLGEGAEDADIVALLAELDARAEQQAIDEATAEQLLLRLRERKLKRELETADSDRLPDLQQALAKVRTRFREFA